MRRRRRKSARGAATYRRVLRLEPLEERRLLSITVNTLADENDGIGVGGISLRDAIAAANAAPGAETIDFDPAPDGRRASHDPTHARRAQDHR